MPQFFFIILKYFTTLFYTYFTIYRKCGFCYVFNGHITTIDDTASAFASCWKSTFHCPHICCWQRLLTLNCPLVDVLFNIHVSLKDVWNPNGFTKGWGWGGAGVNITVVEIRAMIWILLYQLLSCYYHIKWTSQHLRNILLVNQLA